MSGTEEMSGGTFEVELTGTTGSTFTGGRRSCTITRPPALPLAGLKGNWHVSQK